MGIQHISLPFEKEIGAISLLTKNANLHGFRTHWQQCLETKAVLQSMGEKSEYSYGLPQKSFGMPMPFLRMSTFSLPLTVSFLLDFHIFSCTDCIVPFRHKIFPLISYVLYKGALHCFFASTGNFPYLSLEESERSSCTSWTLTGHVLFDKLMHLWGSRVA